MFHNFLLHLGSALGTIAALIISIVITRRLVKLFYKRKAPARVWRNFYDQLLLDDEYEEAKIIYHLIKDKRDKDKIRTPKGYKVYTKNRISYKGNYNSDYNEEAITMETDWIIKKVIRTKK